MHSQCPILVLTPARGLRTTQLVRFPKFCPAGRRSLVHRMPSIAFMTVHSRFPWLRQLVDDIGEGWRFTFNEIAEDCAFIVVYDEPSAPITTHVPVQQRMVILSEPPGIKTYTPAYLAQFGIVMGPIEPKNHVGHWIAAHPALPWFFGIGFGKDGLHVNLDLDSLRALPPPEKINAISVVISSKAQLPKHRARLAFVEKLQTRLGERLHIFGRGFKQIDDKAEAILPYAYHLVLENNDIPHFWTEKTADAYLGWAFPVFSGCNNLGDYMPSGSFLPVDIEAQDTAIAAIEAMLEQDNYISHLPALLLARERLLREHNLFAVLAAQIRALPAALPLRETPETLTKNSKKSLISRMHAQLKAALSFTTSGENRGA